VGVTLRFRALQPFGVEIERDLAEPLAPSEAYHLNQLFARHGLILARGQSLSMAQQRGFCAHLGPILDREGETGTMSNETGGYSAVELGWHADAAYTRAPFDALSLHALDVVDEASSTRFVSAQDASDSLDPALRAALDGREQEMISPYYTALAEWTCDSDEPQAMKRGRLPAIRSNPHNGRDCLWVSQMQTAALVGMEREEGRALLHRIFAHLYAPESVFEHRWRKGDLLIWDNIALQHARGEIADVGPRVLQRVIVGTEGVAPHIGEN
jgi:taurine dioxygenase